MFPKALSGAEKQARHRERRQRAGLKQLRVWIDPADEAEVRDLIAPYIERADTKARAVELPPIATGTPSPPPPRRLWVTFDVPPPRKARHKLQKAGLSYDRDLDAWTGPIPAPESLQKLRKWVEGWGGAVDRR